MKKVNFVYIANEYLRHLESEFSAGIIKSLGEDWDASDTIVKYKKGAVNMTFFIYRRSHIMMSHGVADKNYLLRKDAQGGLEINKYRYVCVPGEWTKNKLLEHPDVSLTSSQIKVVGWPRIDNLLSAQKKRKTSMFQDISLSQKKPHEINVLWAPTHGGGNREGENLSSYPFFLKYDSLLGNIFNYNKALHPAVAKSKKSTFEQLLEADIVISDRGTLVYEAWALGKPVIFPSWIIEKANLKYVPGSAEHYIFQNKIGLHASSIEHLIGLILTNPTIGDDVRTFMNQYLDPSTYGKSYELIANVIKEVWDSNDLRVKAKVAKLT